MNISYLSKNDRSLAQHFERFSATALVVGGGSSGLYLSSLFQQSDFDYCLLEASETIGGRMSPDPNYVVCLDANKQLLFSHFIVPGLPLGAEQISRNHELVNKLVSEHNLTIRKNSMPYRPFIVTREGLNWRKLDEPNTDLVLRALCILENGSDRDKVANYAILSEYWDTKGFYKNGFGEYLIDPNDVVAVLYSQVDKNRVHLSKRVLAVERRHLGYKVTGHDFEADCKYVIFALPPWQLLNIDLPPDVTALIEKLAKHLYPTTWPAKFVVILENSDKEILPQGYSEFLLVDDEFCAQVWIPQKERLGKHCLLSGVIAPIDVSMLPKYELACDWFDKLGEFFGARNLKVKEFVVYFVASHHKGAYPHYPGDQTFHSQVEPILAALNNKNMFFVGGSYDRDDFGNLSAGFNSAQRVFEQILGTSFRGCM
ncbi:MAG: FAD-dependent oxidoreductase [Deltaproteobacteria bacterium]|nr:FAD-dependent oxidoreductase [Deltaproteobacteria bacterium]MCX7952826.1 FAD-dependent oxidoreductase [Deltaproteobacteria bacterium]